MKPSQFELLLYWATASPYRYFNLEYNDVGKKGEFKLWIYDYSIGEGHHLEADFTEIPDLKKQKESKEKLLLQSLKDKYDKE